MYEEKQEKIGIGEDKMIRYKIILKDSNIDLSKMDVLKKIDLAYATKDLDILEQLSEDKDEYIRYGVAENKRTPEEILRKLANDEDRHVRETIALNPNTTEEVLRKLAGDKTRVVREYVAKNSNTPVDVLRKLSDDEDKDVRERVAENYNCPVDILRKLADDEYEWTRMYVAYHPNCPIDVLEKLADDEYIGVRRQVAKKLKLAGKQLKNTIELTKYQKDILNKALSERIKYNYEGEGNVSIRWLNKQGLLKFPEWYLYQEEGIQGFIDLEFEGQPTTDNPEDLTESLYNYFLLPLINIKYSYLDENYSEYSNKLIDKVENDYLSGLNKIDKLISKE